MNIPQAQADLSLLGNLEYCDVSGVNSEFFIISITEFTYSNAHVTAIITAIEMYIKDVYPIVDHLGYDIQAKTAKIQLSKAVI